MYLLCNAYKCGRSVLSMSTVPYLHMIIDTVPTYFKCISTENIRKSARDKKPVSSLRVIQNWRIVMSIVDGMVTTFDINSCQPISQLTDTKGCTLYTVHETSSLLFVALKRKLLVFQWTGAGFSLLRELVTAETPRALYAVVNCLLVGYKKHYEALNVSSLSAVKICDVEREHRMIVLEVPPFPRRGHSVVLSNSLQGIMFDIDVNSPLMTAVSALSGGGGLGTGATGGGVGIGASGGGGFAVSSAAGNSGGGNSGGSSGTPVNGSLFGSTHALAAITAFDQRLEWQSAPLQSVCILPYIISLQASQIEIHHVLTLAVVQTIKLAPMIGNTMPVPAQLVSAYTHFGCGTSLLPPSATTYSQSYAKHTVYVAQSDGIAIYPMVPLPNQIQALVDNSVYEEALSLSSLCTADGSADVEVLNYISVTDIHKRYAYNIFQRGDYDGAISHFLLAETKFRDVLSLFPEFIPKNFAKYEIYLRDTSGFGGGSGSRQSSPSRGAASALALYCEKIRPSVKALAEKAEKLRSTQSMSGAAGQLHSHSHHHQQLHQQQPAAAANSMMRGRKHSEESSTLLLTLDPEELIRDAIILDTLYVSALVHCSPPRRSVIVGLLSKPNYCHLDSCSLMIASQGNAYTEALLWLFRSHSDHKRVLSALSESNCCGENAWNRRQYYVWVTEYLTTLWRNSTPVLPTSGSVSTGSSTLTGGGVSATGAGIDQEVSAHLLVNQVLPVLRTVFEYDANMGLSVLVNNKIVLGGSSTISAEERTAGVGVGGQGVELSDILQFLSNLHKPGKDSGSPVASVTTLPLTSGKAIETAYLSWLVGTGLAAPATHNQFILALVGVIAKEEAQQDDVAAATATPSTSSLIAVYRKALQEFLQTSTDYDCAAAQTVIPSSFTHEHALLLSRLGRHDQVLDIYVHELQDLLLCEAYCDRIYAAACDLPVGKSQPYSSTDSQMQAQGAPQLPSRGGGGFSPTMQPSIYVTSDKLFYNSKTVVTAANVDAADVYLTFIKTLIAALPGGAGAMKSPRGASNNDESDSDNDKMNRKSKNRNTFISKSYIIAMAEKYHRRLDAQAFLACLPPNMTVKSLHRYLMMVYEHENAKQRNLQVVHQLLRVREVNLRTTLLTPSVQRGSKK